MRFPFLPAVGAALFLTACANTTYLPNNVTVTEENGDAKIVTSAGTIQTSGEGKATIPADFPSDVPLMTNLKLKQVTTFTAPEGKAFSLSWETSASAADVVRDYETDLKNKGWEVYVMTDSSGVGSVAFHRKEDEKRAGSLSITEVDGKTQVVMMFTETEAE